MVKKISRLELCRETLKRIIQKLTEGTPFNEVDGSCKHCREVGEHADDCIFQSAKLVTRNVRKNKKRNDKDDKEDKKKDRGGRE